MTSCDLFCVIVAGVWVRYDSLGERCCLLLGDSVISLLVTKKHGEEKQFEKQFCYVKKKKI